jgi:cell division protein FtsI (penicillin-binding protein 3)
LFAALEDARAELARNRGPVPVHSLRARIPYELAARAGMLRELHPGILIQHDVVRERAAELEECPSLAPLLGTAGYVRASARADADELRAQVAAMFGDAAADGLPEDVLEAAEDQALAVLRAHRESRQRVGRSGVEAAADAELAGLPGLRWAARDARARERGLFRTLDVTPGSDVRVTVDLRLQRLAEQELAATHTEQPGLEKAVVLLAPATGDVLAIAAHAAQRDAQFSAAAFFTRNGALGSVAKPFVLLEHLDAARHGRPHLPDGSVQPCGGTWLTAARERLRCDAAHGASVPDGRQALGHSCNVWFYQLTHGLGPDGLARAYARAGWLPGGAWQAGVPGISRLARPSLAAGSHCLEQNGIGYGLQASALHVARAYAGLATGTLPVLRLIDGGAPPAGVPLGVDPADLAVVREGLELCVTRGTAARIGTLARLGAVGKTGTAEVGAERENNAWFAGWVRGAPPPLAFAAVVYGVPHGAHGADVAGDLIARILERVHAHEELRARWLPGGG